MAEDASCVCPRCRDALDFELDDFLLAEIAARNVVIFAGAGVSTEGRLSAPHSLYDELAHELGMVDGTLSFPDLAERYASQHDGRFRLIKKIQERFEYIDKFYDLRFDATRFYRELATMPYFNDFITTNWDRNFEEICLAKPFVYDPDMRFWEIPKRRVLKIHGTIDDLSSIVATRGDYEECESRLHRSLVGAKLKELLATKTCVFIGYSMRDADFREIFHFVSLAQGKFRKTHYFVSPHADETAHLDQVVPIKTDGSHFLSVIKQHMCASFCYLEDDIYDLVSDELNAVIDEHLELWDKFNGKRYPKVLIAASYQDGLIHGYRLTLDRRGSGEYSDLHKVQAKAMLYDQKIRGYRSKRSYLDVAYFQGYQNTLIALALAKESEGLEPPPRSYYEGVGEMERAEFEELFHKLPNMHKGAFRSCEKVVARWPAEGNLVFQHDPWG